MPTLTLRRSAWILALLAGVLPVRAQDLHVKKNILVGGYVVSNAESSIKGARERTVTQSANGATVTLRQCDLRRTVTLNEQAQTYLVANDPQDENAAKAAALATGTAIPEAQGGKVVVTTTVSDTGERKTLFGYPVRHLKAKAVQEPSADACTQVRQQYEIDGWFADISKEIAACSTFAPPVQQGTGCNDKVISRRVGSGKPGYPLQENITMATPDGGTQTIGIQVSEVSKQELPAEMFDVPTGYRQVKTLAELNGVAPQTQVAQQAPQQIAPQVPQQAPQQAAGKGQRPGGDNGMKAAMLAGMMNPAAVPAAQQQANAMVQQTLGMVGGLPMGQQPLMGPGSGGGMPGMGHEPSGAAAVAAPQALGPKAAGKIRIGIAPPEAQLGQGNNASADYSTPIRNAIVALMSGPAVEIAALDAHVPIQLQAEAQQKQCDFILYSSVAVKHNSGGGLGGLMKKAGPLTSMVPMAGMGKGMGGAIAAQAASAAASTAAMSAQQQAMNQLTGFNGQIKSKDDVSIQYQLYPTGQTAPRVQNELKGKAKTDGEDVLTPLLQQTANTVLTEVTKK